MTSRIFLVVNPNSGNGRTGKQFDRVAQAVRAAAGAFEHGFTERPMHAAELARRALRDGFDLIVAVGGDGTVNEVVNGFFDGDDVVRPGAALAVIPRGTGGDFRKNFDWSVDLDQAAARLRGDATRPLDVGRLRLTDPAGASRTRYFANIASFGVSGKVDAVVNESSKILGGKVSFALGSLKAMAGYRDQRVRVRFDEGAPEELTVTTLAVGNGQYFGGGMRVCPQARTDDGVFDVTVWSGYRLRDFLLKSKALYDGTHVRFPGTRTLKARKVVAESDEEVLLDVDGEQPGRLPAAFEILPASLRVKV